MIDYKKIVLNWLMEDYVKRELGDQSIDIHVDQLLNIRSNKKYVIEGIKLYEALINICEDNELLDDFIPVFRISLKDIKEIKKININSLEDILKDIDHNRPPEICLYRKISVLSNYIYEEYKYSLMACYFDNIFKDNYYFYYSFFKSEDDIHDDWKYSRMISIEYNENNENHLFYPNEFILKNL